MVRVEPAESGDADGDMMVDTAVARESYRDWLATRLGPGPGGLRRSLWYVRPLKPTPAAYAP